MDVWTPIRAHAEWITQLRETLYRRDLPLTRTIGNEESCDVGQWLARHRNSIGHLAVYRNARSIHSKFHRRAAYCQNLAREGHRLEALEETNQNGELRRLSRLLVQAFQDLRLQVEAESLPVSWTIGEDSSPDRGRGDPL